MGQVSLPGYDTFTRKELMDIREQEVKKHRDAKKKIKQKRN